MKIPLKKERKRKQTTKKAVGKSRKKGTGNSPGEFEDGYGDLESRSPTPTPPVLEPEVTPKPEAPKEEVKEEIAPIIPAQEVIEPVKEIATVVKEDIKVAPLPVATTAPIAYVTPTMAPIAAHIAEPVAAEEDEEDKYIPRLLDAAGNVTPRSRDQHLEPAEWSVSNVTAFLEVNECSNLVPNFVEKDVDGVKFLTLTKKEIMTLVNNKMGPCLKVEHLQKLLKDRLNPAQARLLASFQKK